MKATEFIKLSADMANNICDKLTIDGKDRLHIILLHAIITAEITTELVEKGVIVKDED